jgi:hypothetical protein
VVKTEVVFTEENAKFLAEHSEAMDVLNEMLAEYRESFKEPPEHLKFANRPDWQEKYRRSQDALAAGNVIRHEDVADWDNLGE